MKGERSKLYGRRICECFYYFYSCCILCSEAQALGLLGKSMKPWLDPNQASGQKYHILQMSQEGPRKNIRKKLFKGYKE